MMRCILLTILIASFFVLDGTAIVQAQAIIAGKIVDAETRQPLTGAHVFLSGTKIGTATNSKGQYELRGIPTGVYGLVISMVGYKKVRIEMGFGTDEIKKRDIELKSVVYEMPEVFVGNLDEKWEKYLKRFTNLFIGESEAADSVKILNPEVLRFDSNWWGRLSAEALAPLKIENKALGYRITYYLDEFKHTGGTTEWDGEPVFMEMTPTDSLQASYWKQNRKTAFYGSVRHFLLTLIQNRVNEDGFIVNLERNDAYKFYSSQWHSITAERLISEGEESYLHNFSFFGNLQIIYTNGKENSRFLRWLRERERRPANRQTSYIELNEHPVTIDANGEILEPYGATLFGYFAYERLAEVTPKEYRPEGYPTTIKQ